jgi:hypothetical protein
MPDFDNVYTHARSLAALTDPARQQQRTVLTWAIEVAEHWEALAKLWRDPAREEPETWNGIPLEEISPAHIGELEKVYAEEPLQELRNAVELHRQRRKTAEIERADQINIDARHSVIHQAQPKPRRARCGNCGTRYEITEDPIENHHRAMRHARICARRDTAAEHARLVTEFWTQPMPRDFAERARQMIAAGADPAAIERGGISLFPAPTPAPRRWWQFWRWFR